MIPYRHCSRFTLLLISMVLANGCDDGGQTDSTKIETQDIDANFSVTSGQPGETVVGASLETDRGFSVEAVALAGRESLVAKFDGYSRALVLDPTAPDPRYSTVFHTAAASGPVQIVFHRAHGSTISDPVVILRPEFTVAEPRTGEFYRFGDDLPLEWAPAQPGDVMKIWLRLRCTTLSGGTAGRSFFLQVEDDGSNSYDLGLFPEATDPTIDQSIDCVLSVDFQRIRSSDIAPPFAAGSSMTATQTRTVDDILIGF